MIALLNSKDSNFNTEFEKILKRGAMDIENVEGRVKELLNAIKKQGQSAIIAQVAQFDNWNPTNFSDLKITQEQMQKAYEAIETPLKDSLQLAFERIYAFHSKQKPKTWLDFEENGNILGQKVTPMDRAGLYIPGGKAAYPSSLLMNAIPALVAGAGPDGRGFIRQGGEEGHRHARDCGSPAGHRLLHRHHPAGTDGGHQPGRRVRRVAAETQIETVCILFPERICT